MINHQLKPSGLIISVRRALAYKLRGPGFKTWPGTVVAWPLYNNVECSARLKISCELNPVTEGKQGILHFQGYILN